MKKISMAAAFMAAATLAACATGPTPQEIATADYGPPPPAEHQQIIRDLFAERLIDPTAPLYTFDEPRKGYLGRLFGWRVCGTVNSKNRMGGYAGRERYLAMFRHGKLLYLESGTPRLDEACQR